MATSFSSPGTCAPSHTALLSSPNPPCSHYRFIVFRASDVKDLKIEQNPVTEPVRQPVPEDPAIMSVRDRL